MAKKWDWKTVSNPIKSDKTGNTVKVGIVPSTSDNAVNVGFPGVYVIYKEPKDEKIAVYVGRTDDSVFKRINDHCKMDEPNDELRAFLQARHTVRFCCLKVENEDDQKDYEHTLYRHYGGKDKLFNENQPSGKCVDMEYPFE